MKETISLAIKGEGFFIVKELEKEEKHYTRRGLFVLNEDGYIMTECGKFLLDVNEKPFQWQDSNDLKQIKIVFFTNTNSLMRMDGGMYVSTEESEHKNESEVVQLFPETSLVDLGEIFEELCQTQNEVVRNSKVITPINFSNLK